MMCEGYAKVWKLAPRQLLQLDGARGTRLHVERGTLWVTLEDDLRDIVIERGGSFTIDRGGLTLVEAQNDASVCVEPHYMDKVNVGAERPGVASRLTQWLRRLMDSASDPHRFVPHY